MLSLPSRGAQGDEIFGEIALTVVKRSPEASSETVRLRVSGFRWDRRDAGRRRGCVTGGTGVSPVFAPTGVSPVPPEKELTVTENGLGWEQEVVSGSFDQVVSRFRVGVVAPVMNEIDATAWLRGPAREQAHCPVARLGRSRFTNPTLVPLPGQPTHKPGRSEKATAR
jgi:hypothetical protein